MEVKEIKMSSIQLSEFNTRKDLEAGTEEAGLNDLAQSIKERGLLNPVTVKKNYGLPLGNFFVNLISGYENMPQIQKF